MARNDFSWLVSNILYLYRDTEIDVRSSSEYRQLMEDIRVEENLVASELVTDTGSVISKYDADLYKRVQERNNNVNCSSFNPTT